MSIEEQFKELESRLEEHKITIAAREADVKNLQAIDKANQEIIEDLRANNRYLKYALQSTEEILHGILLELADERFSGIVESVKSKSLFSLSEKA